MILSMACGMFFHAVLGTVMEREGLEERVGSSFSGLRKSVDVCLHMLYAFVYVCLNLSQQIQHPFGSSKAMVL